LFTAVYHLGYSDFRGEKLRKPLAGDVIWSVPTLVTLSPLGSPIAHAGLHVAAVVHSYETDVFLPPHRAASNPGRLEVRRALAGSAQQAAPGLAALAMPSTAGAKIVKVFVPRAGSVTTCTRVYPLLRTVTKPAVLAGAMKALLAGPTAAERRAGFAGWFSTRTANKLRSVRLTRGVAYVDFEDFSRTVPNASSSCGSTLLLAQLDRTARQFPTVERTVYSFNGSHAAFYEWLQREPPEVGR
jgi:hypothetical protein